MLQGMSTPSLKPLRKPSAPAMELKERGDETDLPDIGDAFPPPPPPPPPRRRIAREEPPTPLLAASRPASARAKNLSASRAAHAATRCSAPRRPATSAARRFATAGRGTHLVQVSALASALACDGETTGWRCSDGTRARTSRTRCDA